MMSQQSLCSLMKDLCTIKREFLGKIFESLFMIPMPLWRFWHVAQATGTLSKVREG